MTVLVETIERLSSARTIEAVADVVRGAARRLSGAHGVAFVLRDGDHCHYLDEDAIEPLWKGRRFPMETCVSGWAMNHRETVVIPEIRDDPRIPQDAYRPTFVRSLVMTPVRPADPLAAIGAYWDHPRQPTPEEVENLSLVARATATALENVGLLASLRDSLERREALIRELDHRVKNTLASTLSIANQTLKGSKSPERFVQAFNGRLMAMSHAHDLLGRSDWTGAALSEAMDEVFAPDDRVTRCGPAADLAQEASVSMVLALHELLDNARRHGALSDGGEVALDWDFVDGRFEMTWRERGGPEAVAPTGRSFGLQVIEAAARSLGGRGEASFTPEGLTWRLSAPISQRIRPA